MDMHYIFEDEYVRNQIKAFNAPEYDKNEVVVKYMEAVGRLDEYLNVSYRSEPLKIPLLKIHGKTWMSLTPMEIQSQEVAAQMLEGDVGILGLGLGYIVWRAMISEEVDSITVFESNREVIDYFLEAFKDREGFDKVRIQEGDARETCKGYDFNVLYNDIYPSLLPDEVVDDIELFCDNNDVGMYRFWGQERVLLDALLDDIGNRSRPSMDPLDRRFLGSWMEDDNLSGLYRPICDRRYYSRVLDTLEEYL